MTVLPFDATRPPDREPPATAAESPFLATMRELERVSPDHAEVFRGLAADTLAALQQGDA